MNNADLIVKTLKRANISHGFGVPSGNVLPLMEAMRTGGIDFVLTAHEGSASFAADVSARVTGVPGLAIATLGPGATNLATGVGCAYLDRSPLIAITCTLNEALLGRRIQMWIDHHELFKPITKASFRLETGKIAETLKAALRIALTEPHGPVHLDLPEDVALAEAIEDVPDLDAPAPLPACDDASLAKAAAIIKDARRPIAVIGANAMRIADTGLLARFVDHFGLPFATTTMAKGLIDDNHPLCIGCIERGKRQLQRAFLSTADLIVGIGYDTIEVEYEAWIGKTPLLHIDIETADTNDSVDIRHQAVGDLAGALNQMVTAGRGSQTGDRPNDWEKADIAAHRSEFQSALRPKTERFSPHQAIDVVRDVLPDNGILAFDVGAHTHQIAAQWAVSGPKQFLITNGWSSMGFGLPAAIAAKIAHADLPVVCLLGDGCFQMTCGELTVAQRLGLSLPVVVLDDRWLSLIKIKQDRRNLPHYATATLAATDLGPPAHYFGVSAVGVRTPEALRDALQRALESAGPTVIEAVVDPGHYSDTVFD